MGLISCGSAGRADAIEFPETILLKGEEKTISGGYLKYPYRVRLNDTSLFVMDLHPGEYYCHEFSYPSMGHRRSFVKRGEAEHELLDAENIRLDNQGRFWVLDANRKKIACFNAANPFEPQHTILLDDRLIRTLDFDLFEDSTFIVPDYTGMHRLSVVNSGGKITRNLFHIPTAETGQSGKGKGNVPLAQAWRSFLSYNPTHGVVAMATQLGQVLEIYDVRKEQVVNIVRPAGMEPQFVTKANYAVPTGIMGYSDVYVG